MKNYNTEQFENGVPIKMWTKGVPVEDDAKKQLAVPATVAQAVANLYRVFRSYKPPETTLDVCLACCMDSNIEMEMRQLPLASLYQDHFYQYNDSAKSPVQPADEVKYFIPRMFELLSEGCDLHHSTEIYLDRVGRMPQGSLSKFERKALDDFAFAFFSEGLRQLPFIQSGRFQRDDAFTILLMFDVGGFNIDSLLSEWLLQESDTATLHYVHATRWNFWLDDGEIRMPFAENLPEFREKIKAWITNVNHRQLFKERISSCAQRLSSEVLKTRFDGSRTHEDALNEVLQYVME